MSDNPVLDDLRILSNWTSAKNPAQVQTRLPRQRSASATARHAWPALLTRLVSPQTQARQFGKFQFVICLASLHSADPYG